MKINHIFDNRVLNKVRTKSYLQPILLMAKVKFTSALKRFFPAISEMEIQGATVKEMLYNVDQAHPGILQYLTDEHGQLRRHVNIFVKGELIRDRATLNDRIASQDEIIIFQALSGG
jgi:molybdopterin synthase sulfur carrier subunit